ncbi:hypothetical protein CHO01_17130 [Cellulomonas hominis]|uniref:Uncharacterized protein n=1 Tax=Cellulomonas hominis TaxID=156981 RepID=A0A511FE43_9CELL|nr:hypothetical protein [Cellulomonas hominis]MBB5474559.1 hypothetical protein [Cellulomonas hominis]NKY05603.1 hypothetical protein [Cellulomonas hominis]GEL46597.1 hypothetical protein CHO01_17130 [Cellulomonas hominis]
MTRTEQTVTATVRSGATLSPRRALLVSTLHWFGVLSTGGVPLVQFALALGYVYSPTPAVLDAIGAEPLITLQVLAGLYVLAQVIAVAIVVVLRVQFVIAFAVPPFVLALGWVGLNNPPIAIALIAVGWVGLAAKSVSCRLNGGVPLGVVEVHCAVPAAESYQEGPADRLERLHDRAPVGPPVAGTTSLKR